MRDPYRDAIAAAARSTAKRPPSVLPFYLRGASRIEADAEGWPKTLDMPDGCGIEPAIWWGDEPGPAANDECFSA